MTAKTGAQRQSSLTARRKAAGLVRVEVWVHPDWAQDIRNAASTCFAKKTNNEELVKLTYAFSEDETEA